MTIKQLIDTLDKLIDRHENVLSSEDMDIKELIGDNKQLYPNIYEIYLGPYRKDRESDIIDDDTERELKELTDLVEHNVAIIEEYTSADYADIYDICYDAFQTANIVHSPLSTVIKAALRRYKRLNLDINKPMQLYTMIYQNVQDSKFDTSLIDSRYNSHVDYTAILMFLTSLLCEAVELLEDDIVAELEKLGERNELTEWRDKLNNFCETIIKLGSLKFFYILDYSISDTQQWPFNRENALQLLERKLSKATPNEKQSNKLRMIGADNYKDISLDDILLLCKMLKTIRVDRELKSKRYIGFA